MMFNVTKMVIVAGVVGAACAAALAAPPKVYPPVAAPMVGGDPASFDPNMPSYRFTEHVTRWPGQLIQKDKGVVALEVNGDLIAIFAKWDEFESYATCAGDVDITCKVAYFDYEGGEILPFVLPLEAALSHEYMVQLAVHGSKEFLATPPVGSGIIAVRNRYTPSSGFAQRVSYSGADLRVVEPGVLAVDHPSKDYPHLLFAFGPGFQAFGHCSERMTKYCIMNFFDHDASETREYLIGLEDALKRDTYVNLQQLLEADRLEWEALTAPPQS